MRRALLFVAALVPAVLCFSFRASAQVITPSPYWRNTVAWATDPFAVAPTDPNDPRWVKFTILLSDPTRVYFQDSVHYPFHYEFAAERLDPYLGIPRTNFDAISLYASGQQVQLGAVLFPPGSPSGVGPREFGIQFIRNDALTAQQVVDMFNLVKTRVDASPAAAAIYMPTFEQTPSAQANQAFLASNGVTVSSTARWATGNRVYAAGWALGTVRFVPGSQVQAAFNAGTLRPEDILLTDGIPAELPFVSGIISLAPATPNSHVALLAQTYNVPFVHLAIQSDQAAAQAMVGHKAALSAFVVNGVSDVEFTDIDAWVPASFQGQVLAMRGAGTITVTPVEARGAYSISTDVLTPADVRYVGGKASNYGYLRRAIPGNARPAVAFTFDLWNGYLDQVLSNGLTLRQEITNRLAPFQQWPPNFAQLSSALTGVRTLFTSTSQTTFSPAQSSAVLATLQDPAYGFDPSTKLRFRSSTNVEDLSGYTGAGLYDSFSGCLMDDIDADTTGPSWCDATDSGEKGVFRAIRKVYASFYNDNAYIQRLRAGVDESQVGMAMLCHHSFPDATEMANGVATYDRRPFPAVMNLVSQLGATSITNPDDGSIPEEAVVYYFGGDGLVPFLQRTSNRVPLGETVMPTWPDAHVAFGALFAQVGSRIALETGDSTSVLDFEYKRVAPWGDLDVKQVRKLPQPSTTPSVTPVLLAQPTQYCLFQGEYGNVFSNHRLKVQMSLTARNTFLTPEETSHSLFAAGSLTFNNGCVPETLAGPPGSYPGASYAFAQGTATDSWSAATMANPTSFSLATTNVPTLVAPSANPLLTLHDVGQAPRASLVLSATHERPVPVVDIYALPDTTLTESALVCPCSELHAGALQHRVYTMPGGVTVDTQFYWVEPPVFPVDFYTADLAAWDRTIITGLASRPIELHGYFSQTYKPGHHNHEEFYIFDPRLEPGIDPAILAELAGRHIAYVYLYFNYNTNIQQMELMDANGDVCPAVCDGVDFNADGLFPDTQDIDDFLTVFSGGPCSNDPSCGDIDFNNDGLFPDTLDIDALLSVFSGGACLR
ncbi:MAG: PEP/pyruvate-binding domain-containing protein [Phycisphaerales bacterium]